LAYTVTIFRGKYNFTSLSLKFQVKVKFTLEQAMKTLRGIEVYCTLALTSALDGGGWSVLLPGLANLDGCGISSSHRVSIPGPFFPSESLYRLPGTRSSYCRFKKYILLSHLL
jgi:hypothetical protein